MTEHNLPVPDDAPWLNLSPEEIQNLRENKRYLAAQAKQKLRKLKAQQQTQELINAAHRIADGGVPLGKLIREGHLTNWNTTPPQWVVFCYNTLTNTNTL
jgi:hypothetical protein